MKSSLLSLFTTALFLSPAAIAASSADFSALADFIQTTKTITKQPSGTAIAVVKNGKIVYEGYFGYADIQGKKSVDRETLFYIASTTKPFMALHTLLKENQGRLDTKTSLQSMFPKSGFNSIDAVSVTVKDLLTHTSGIDNQPLVWATAFSGIHDAMSRHELVALSYSNEKAPFGKFDYTNVGYNVLSVWLDKTFDQPWQTQMSESLFVPLGMERTSAYISEAKGKGWLLAKPYSVLSLTRNEPLYLEKSDNTMQAAGGLISTAPDLATFLIAQLDDGMLDGTQVFPKSVIEKSHSLQATVDSDYLDFKRAGYAWGWYLGQYKGKQMLHHFGGFSGFHAHLSFIPEEGIGLVVLNNEDFIGARLTNLIADYTYGVLLKEDGIKEKVAGRFNDLWEKAKGLETAVVREQEKIKGRAWRLSKPQHAYIGTYSNALLGDIAVTLSDDKSLVIRWGHLTAVATGYDEQDCVRVEFSPNSGNVLSFLLKEDTVDAISFENMTFKKVGADSK